MRFAPAVGQRLTNDAPPLQRCAGMAVLSAPLWLAVLCSAAFYSAMFCSAVLCSAPLSAAELTNSAAAARPIDFGRDIQPILARRCFACHGPDKAEAGLRLNRREAALAELDSGAHPLVPGKPDESEIFRRITSTDADERMPPGDRPLTEQQVALVRQWIAEGAEWRGHWAFEPIGSPTPPATSRTDWAAGEIDQFILSRLERAGLSPAPAAEKGALLRRVSYDLTGLPPTPEEMAAFLADSSPEAYAKVVDRLLDSPRYGERWGRHWLDVVRFAETNSFERDGPKPHAWRYRDYVIRSLNADKPYDRFLVEQLAGDELPGAGSDQLIATGFYRLGPWDDEPADGVQRRFDELDDIVSTVGQAMLGLTVNCARCHDHKIDPLTQRDYYQMAAFFGGVRGMASEGPTIERQIFVESGSREEYLARQQSFDVDQREIEQAIDQIRSTLLTRYREANGSSAPGEIYAADLEELEFRFYRDTYESLPDFEAVKAETVGKLPGFLFDLSPATRETAFGFLFTGKLVVPVEGDYTFYLDSDDGARLRIGKKTRLVYDGLHGLGNEREVIVHLPSGRQEIWLEYFQQEGLFGLRLDWSGPGFARRPLSKNADHPVRPVDLVALMASDGVRLLGQAELDRHEELVRKLTALKTSRNQAEYALSVTEGGPAAPEMFIMERGNAHVPGAKVEPAVPGILAREPLPIPPTEPSAATCGRRLALARWIASPDNPLTARVMANRLWQQHFGRGIVRSPNNFGAMGIPPTHPELLDWLARRLIESQWRLKPLHRLVVLSNAYQMASLPSQQAATADPLNDLFSHFDMRRLSAEELRDSILSVAGQLNFQMYGPGVFPKISAEVLAGQSQPGSGWGQSSPQQQARRSIYIHVKRSLITPLLASFDFPDTDSSCEARFATTPPTQALTLLNGEFLQEEAAHFAARLAREAGAEPAARIALATRLAFGREPTAEETARGQGLIERLRSKFQLPEEAAWKYYCLTILNRNELLYLD